MHIPLLRGGWVPFVGDFLRLWGPCWEADMHCGSGFCIGILYARGHVHGIAVGMVFIAGMDVEFIPRARLKLLKWRMANGVVRCVI